MGGNAPETPEDSNHARGYEIMGWLTMGKSAFGMLFFSSLNGISLHVPTGCEKNKVAQRSICMILDVVIGNGAVFLFMQRVPLPVSVAGHDDGLELWHALPVWHCCVVFVFLRFV